MGLVPGTEKSAIMHRQRFLQQKFDEKLHPDVAESVQDFEEVLQRLLNADADTAVGDADGPVFGPVDPITHPLFYDDV